MTPQETFVTRLRRHRQRNQISLEEIAAATCIKVDLLEALEQNDLSGWPHGLYARAWIRAYATVVGLEPNDTVDDFCRLFVNGDRRSNGTIREMATIVAAPPQYKDEFPHADRRRRTDQDVDAPQAHDQPAQWHTLSSALRPLWNRLSSLAPAQKSLRRGLP
jgi:hypothetical protein